MSLSIFNCCRRPQPEGFAGRSHHWVKAPNGEMVKAELPKFKTHSFDTSEWKDEVSRAILRTSTAFPKGTKGIGFKATPGVDYSQYGWKHVKTFYADEWVPENDTRRIKELEDETLGSATSKIFANIGGMFSRRPS